MDGTSLSPSQRPRPRGSRAALPGPIAERSLRLRGRHSGPGGPAHRVRGPDPYLERGPQLPPNPSESEFLGRVLHSFPTVSSAPALDPHGPLRSEGSSSPLASPRPSAPSSRARPPHHQLPGGPRRGARLHPAGPPPGPRWEAGGVSRGWEPPGHWRAVVASLRRQRARSVGLAFPAPEPIPAVPCARRRRVDSLEAAQGAPRDPRRDSRGERSPWLPLETRPDSPGEPGMQPRAFSTPPATRMRSAAQVC